MSPASPAASPAATSPATASFAAASPAAATRAAAVAGTPPSPRKMPAALWEAWQRRLNALVLPLAYVGTGKANRKWWEGGDGHVRASGCERAEASARGHAT